MKNIKIILSILTIVILVTTVAMIKSSANNSNNTSVSEVTSRQPVEHKTIDKDNVRSLKKHNSVSNDAISENNIDKVEIFENTVAEDENIITNDTNDINQIDETISDNNIGPGNIFIGDSRFVGMNNICKIDSNQDNYVIAKVGEGYNYLVNTAIQEATNIVASNESIETWNIIICLGVNDLGNLNKYIEAYNNIDKTNINIILVSVNPVEYHNSITNEQIEEFNNAIKEIENTKFIDTYSKLIEDGYNTTDGVHYDALTYNKIYSYIVNNI